MIVLSEHALERMEERGASRQEVRRTVREGESFPDRQDRTGFRFEFEFGAEWNGTYYEKKELTVYAAPGGEDGSDWIVVTVISRFY